GFRQKTATLIQGPDFRAKWSSSLASRWLLVREWQTCYPRTHLSSYGTLAKNFLRRHGMKGFLFGLGLGVGLGILFAPMSGEETRDNITQRVGDLTDQARDKFEEGRDRVGSGISAIRSCVQTGPEQRPTGTESGNV